MTNEIEWKACIECGDEPTKRIGGSTYCDACSSSSPDKMTYKLTNEDFEQFDWQLDGDQD